MKLAVTSMVVSQVNSLNVRSEASIGSSILTRMDAGDEAVTTERQGNWVRISFNGVHGWVHTDYVSKLPASK